MTEADPLLAVLPPYSISQSIVRGDSTASDFDIVCEVGQGMVAVTGEALRRTGREETARLLKARSLKVSSYHAGLRILELGDIEADAAIGAAIRDAAAIGAALVSVSPGPKGANTWTQADKIYVARLLRAAPLARELDVRLGVEPLHPFLCANGYINTLRHGAEIVDRAPHSSLILDTAHVFWDREVFTDIERCGGSIGLVQLGQISLQQLLEKRWARAPFDDGAAPLSEILRAVHEAGYRGAYEDENLLPNAMSRAETVAHLSAAARWFRALW